MVTTIKNVGIHVMAWIASYAAAYLIIFEGLKLNSESLWSYAPFFFIGFMLPSPITRVLDYLFSHKPNKSFKDFVNQLSDGEIHQCFFWAVLILFSFTTAGFILFLSSLGK